MSFVEMARRPSGVAQWEPILPALARRFRVAAYSLCGEPGAPAEDDPKPAGQQ